jgi:hypothetical protein
MNIPNHFIFVFILVLIFTNLIRFFELKEYTTMFTLKQYLFNMNGILYSLVIFAFFLMGIALNFVANLK